MSTDTESFSPDPGFIMIDGLPRTLVGRVLQATSKEVILNAHNLLLAKAAALSANLAVPVNRQYPPPDAVRSLLAGFEADVAEYCAQYEVASKAQVQATELLAEDPK